MHGENVAGDFDQIAVELPPIPGVEDLSEGLVVEAGSVLEQPVGLANQLHVAIFDAVVHHLDIVAGAPGADPVAAGDVVIGADLGGDRLKDRLDQRPGGGRAAGHQARPFECTFLAARDSGSYIEQPCCLDLAGPSLGVAEERVAAVDDDVARGEQGGEGRDDLVNRRAGFHHQHHLAGRLESGDEVLDAVTADDVGLTAPAGGEGIGDARGAVVDRDRKAPARDIEGEILSHHGQADQADVAGRFGHGRAPKVQVAEHETFSQLAENGRAAAK